MKRDNTNVVVVYEGVVPSVLKLIDNGLIVGFKQCSPRGWFPVPERVHLLDGVPADTRRWPEPVHQAFANMNFQNPGRVESFVKLYGFSGHFCNLSESWQQAADDRRWFIDPSLILKYQAQLREAWGEKRPNLWFHPRSIKVDAKDGQLRLVAHDLWTLICIGFLKDHAAGKTKVCKFEGCKWERYFISSRRDQKCCSKSCRSSKNMQEWRSNAENREHEQLIRRIRRSASRR
jgi:hypothetical protein